MDVIVGAGPNRNFERVGGRPPKKRFHAEQGLLISWGGFKSSVIQEARQNFFTIRLWDSGDLLAMILRNHDKFPDNLKARLPLERAWALVLGD